MKRRARERIPKMTSRRVLRKKRTTLFMIALFWALSTLTCLGMLGKDLEYNTGAGAEIQAGDTPATTIPIISRGGSEYSARIAVIDSLPDESGILKKEPDKSMALGYGEIENANREIQEEESSILDSVSSTEPLVLIYHTHATESYQPVSTGNFHSIDEKGTVREVGGVLAAALKDKGINVIHDKSIHDSPSYSKSYSRSLEAAQKILGTNPSIKIIIDLHRDAAAYRGNSKQTFAADGKEAAQFCLVVGEGNGNVNELKAFANKVNQKANNLYPGFSKGIILKEYKYNQYIADDYILLEMGNNQNNIEEAKQSALMFARVIEEVLKDW